MCRTSDPYACLLRDDQRRLRWLREDLTSCLVQIGGILRQTSGAFGTIPASHVTIAGWDEPLAASTDPSALPADLAGEIPIHVPATITWVWADGTRLTYDWHSHTCGISPQDD